MTKSILYLFIAGTFFISCDRVKQKTKETINKGGETVGQTATEFIEGVSEGVDKTLQCELSISKELTALGVSTGKYSIENADKGKNNRLVLYLIFDKDIDQELSVKAYDKTSLETGRSSLKIKEKAGHAGYYDFVFDERTYIEVKSILKVE